MDHRRLVQLALGALLLTSPAGATEPAGGLGRWITETGNFEVEIAPCGGALCGTVVKVLGNRSMRDPSVEMQPADAYPMLGRQILTDLEPAGDGQWRGYVYNRENGKTYSCIVTVLATGQLEVRGYVGLPLFGRTSTWHRP